MADINSNNDNSNIMIDLGNSLFVNAERFGCRSKYYNKNNNRNIVIDNDNIKNRNVKNNNNHYTGILHKRGHKVKNWKKRYFTIDRNILEYYSDHRKKGSYIISKNTVITKLDNESIDNHHYLFTIDQSIHYHYSNNEIINNGIIDKLILSANSDKDRSIWLEVLDTAKHGGFPLVLIPEIWNSSFYPQLDLEIEYPTLDNNAISSVLSIDDGNITTPTLVKSQPTIKYHCSQIKSIEDNNSSIGNSRVKSVRNMFVKGTEVITDEYTTLIMIDIDHPRRGHPSQAIKLHWLVVNIHFGNIEDSDTVTPYVSPDPYYNSELHRYFFIVFAQTARLSEDAVTSCKECITLDDNKGFNYIRWINKMGFEHPPIAVNGFYAGWDESCDDLHSNNGVIPLPEFLSPKQSDKNITIEQDNSISSKPPVSPITPPRKVLTTKLSKRGKAVLKSKLNEASNKSPEQSHNGGVSDHPITPELSAGIADVSLSSNSNTPTLVNTPEEQGIAATHSSIDAPPTISEQSSASMFELSVSDAGLSESNSGTEMLFISPGDKNPTFDEMEPFTPDKSTPDTSSTRSGKPPIASRSSSGNHDSANSSVSSNVNSNGTTSNSSPSAIKDTVTAALSAEELDAHNKHQNGKVGHVSSMNRKFSMESLPDTLYSEGSTHSTPSSGIHKSILKKPPLVNNEKVQELGDSFYLGSDAGTASPRTVPLSQSTAARERNNTSFNSRLSWDMSHFEMESNDDLSSMYSKASSTSGPPSILKRQKSGIKKTVSFKLPEGYSGKSLRIKGRSMSVDGDGMASEFSAFGYGLGIEMDFDVDAMPDYEIPSKSSKVSMSTDGNTGRRGSRNLSPPPIVIGENNNGARVVVKSKVGSKSNSVNVNAKPSHISTSDDHSSISSELTSSSNSTLFSLRDDSPRHAVPDGTGNVKVTSNFFTNTAEAAYKEAPSEDVGTKNSKGIAEMKSVTSLSSTTESGCDTARSANTEGNSLMDRVIAAKTTSELCQIFAIKSDSVFDGEIVKKKFSEDFLSKDRFMWIEPSSKSIHWAKSASETTKTCKSKHFILERNALLQSNQSRNSAVTRSSGDGDNPQPESVAVSDRAPPKRSLSRGLRSAFAQRSSSARPSTSNTDNALPTSLARQGSAMARPSVAMVTGTVKDVLLNELTIKITTTTDDYLTISMNPTGDYIERAQDWFKVIKTLAEDMQ